MRKRAMSVAPVKHGNDKEQKVDIKKIKTLAHACDLYRQ
jgi:hypothetical protein